MISLDPGESCLWARWLAEELVACGPWPCFDIDAGEDAVIETQIIVPKFTKNPAHIIELAHRAGACAAAFGWPEEPDQVRWVRPKTWKGNTKKPKLAKDWAGYAINRLVIQALRPHELAIYTVAQGELAAGQRHDLADAVGIGLWHLNRLPAPRTVRA